MKQLIIACFAVFLFGNTYSQTVRPDTLIFVSGKILPCEIIEITETNFKVLTDPTVRDFVSMYKKSKISAYYKNGIKQTTDPGLSTPLSGSQENRQQFETPNFKLAGDLQNRAGTNLVVSDVLLLLGTGFSSIAVASKDQSNKDLGIYASIGCGVLSVIFRIVGHSQISQSGEILMKSTSNVSFHTNGTGLIVKF